MFHGFKNICLIFLLQANAWIRFHQNFCKMISGKYYQISFIEGVLKFIV